MIPAGFRLLTWVCLLLTLALAVLSAHLRLEHAGLGCGDWPLCYGRIGAEPAPGGATAETVDAYRQLLSESSVQHVARSAHRLIATLLGVGVLMLNILAWRRPGLPRLIPSLVLLLTVFLGVLGNYSSGLQRPAIVIGNLAGGFLMAALLWSLRLRLDARETDTPSAHPGLHAAVTFGIVMLTATLLAGALTSANFAATACSGFPDCHGEWLPGPALVNSLDIFRVLNIDASGTVVPVEGTRDIHIAHRMLAWLTAAYLLGLAVFAAKASPSLRVTAVTIAGLVFAQITLAAAAVTSHLPVVLVTSHNAFALFLLLALLSLHHAASTGRHAPRA
jgi:cytochrome c oxidase assembly protein subunit 15